jgi:sn-glycerol 3-phosphate transport system ATP-binding protein
MAEIALRNVTKNYGRMQVIKGFSIDVHDGEFVVIVGPSGCGKSTMLRMVAGLEAITSGEISIGGRVVNDLEPAERDIAMVFQNYALYPHMSVYKNMAYGLKIKKFPPAEIERRVQKAAEILELGPYLERSPRQLSGGQRQRVAMGRAIVREPAAFLFDEPLSNLDAKLRVQMRLEIKTLQKSLGVTSLYVTHDQIEAMTLADRMIVMNNGVAEQIGEPLEVYNDPRTTFVAGFIGSPPMNFVSGELRGGKAIVNQGGDRSAGPGENAVTIGLRPEHLAIVAKGAGLFDGTVGFTEALGAETLIHMKTVAGEDVIVRTEAGSIAPETGETVGVSVDANNLFAFDQTGKRVAKL